MKPRYYTAKALPGGETRSNELADSGLSELLGVELAPGTFNAGLMTTLCLGEPDVEHGPYRLWGCFVSTAEMIKDDRKPYPGWLIRVAGENYPDDFAEIISPIHLRTAMKRQNWPAFPVEIALHSNE